MEARPGFVKNPPHLGMEQEARPAYPDLHRSDSGSAVASRNSHHRARCIGDRMNLTQFD